MITKRLNILKSLEDIKKKLDANNGTPSIDIITKEQDKDTFNMDISDKETIKLIDSNHIKYIKDENKNNYTFNIADLDKLIDLIKNRNYKKYGKRHKPLIIDVIDNSYLEKYLYQADREN